MGNLISTISQELALAEHQVNNVVKLLFDEEGTIPFVARYRKEMTGSLDEVQLRQIRDRYQYLKELNAQRERYMKTVAKLCQEKPELAGKWPSLEQRFLACTSKQELEDLYLPFKPKRRTKATIARDKGLEPLLENILAQGADSQDNLLSLAAPYVTAEGSDVALPLRVKSAEEALAGARDILAERIAENADYRALVRQISQDTGELVAQKVEAPQGTDTPAKAPGGKSQDSSKYQNYFDYREPLSQTVSHRIMAIRRGEAEKVLRVNIEVNGERILDHLNEKFLNNLNASQETRQWVASAIQDSYKRLISPSIETELRLALKNTAEVEAIKVFSDNLEKLLLLPPMPQCTVMGIDPGLRTGSKLAIVDATGKLLFHQTVYPDPAGKANDKTAKAKEVIGNALKKHRVHHIAIGNGTGGREISKLIIGILKSDPAYRGIKRHTVNEAGASVYSTDDIAREEFPDLDPTIRSAISIARRLQDPLAELVKIDPRSIGVGQYQHDVNPTKLSRSLKEVVESCVNRVGVDVNTASPSLLSYVSGIGPALAKNIVRHRESQGRFESRAELTKVTSFGPKAFEQAAGFLRITSGSHPLNNSAVHPERYELVQQISQDHQIPMAELIGNKSLVDSLSLERYVNDELGMPTLLDIATELVKPGRDPREDGSRFEYSEEIAELEDLNIGMVLPGRVTNVTKFGAFVDVGVHQDGLVHISELSDEFVSDPANAVEVGQVLSVRVIDVDVPRRRISLSCKSPAAAQKAPRPAGQQQQGSPAPGRFSQPRKRGPLKPRHGSGQAPRHGGGKRSGPQKPQQSFTVDDLIAKFNAKK